VLSEAASAGFYESPWGQHPKLQILTVEELLDGTVLDYPVPHISNVTLKRRPAKARPRGEQQFLPGLASAKSARPRRKRKKKRGAR
jgi:hypothetical protein